MILVDLPSLKYQIKKNLIIKDSSSPAYFIKLKNKRKERLSEMKGGKKIFLFFKFASKKYFFFEYAHANKLKIHKTG